MYNDPSDVAYDRMLDRSVEEFWGSEEEFADADDWLEDYDDSMRDYEEDDR